MTAYLAVTGHWITREWQLRSEILSFSELEGSHSGENMGEELYVVLEKYNITHKVSRLLFAGSLFIIFSDPKLDFR